MVKKDLSKYVREKVQIKTGPKKGTYTTVWKKRPSADSPKASQGSVSKIRALELPEEPTGGFSKEATRAYAKAVHTTLTEVQGRLSAPRKKGSTKQAPVVLGGKLGAALLRHASFPAGASVRVFLKSGGFSTVDASNMDHMHGSGKFIFGSPNHENTTPINITETNIAAIQVLSVCKPGDFSKIWAMGLAGDIAAEADGCVIGRDLVDDWYSTANGMGAEIFVAGLERYGILEEGKRWSRHGEHYESVNINLRSADEKCDQYVRQRYEATQALLDSGGTTPLYRGVTGALADSVTKRCAKTKDTVQLDCRSLESWTSLALTATDFGSIVLLANVSNKSIFVDARVSHAFADYGEDEALVIQHNRGENKLPGFSVTKSSKAVHFPSQYRKGPKVPIYNAKLGSKESTSLAASAYLDLVKAKERVGFVCYTLQTDTGQTLEFWRRGS